MRFALSFNPFIRVCNGSCSVYCYLRCVVQWSDRCAYRHRLSLTDAYMYIRFNDGASTIFGETRARWEVLSNIISMRVASRRNFAGQTTTNHIFVRRRTNRDLRIWPGVRMLRTNRFSQVEMAVARTILRREPSNLLQPGLVQEVIMVVAKHVGHIGLCTCCAKSAEVASRRMWLYNMSHALAS